jgi:hypothetical protein
MRDKTADCPLRGVLLLDVRVITLPEDAKRMVECGDFYYEWEGWVVLGKMAMFFKSLGEVFAYVLVLL